MVVHPRRISCDAASGPSQRAEMTCRSRVRLTFQGPKCWARHRCLMVGSKRSGAPRELASGVRIAYAGQAPFGPHDTWLECKRLRVAPFVHGHVPFGRVLAVLVTIGAGGTARALGGTHGTEAGISRGAAADRRGAAGGDVPGRGGAERRRKPRRLPLRQRPPNSRHRYRDPCRSRPARSTSAPRPVEPS